MIRLLFDLLPKPDGILGINARNLELIYPYNQRRNFKNVDDKLRCKALLERSGIPTPKTYHAITDRRSLSRWEEAVVDCSRFVVKPTNGYGGNGIKLVSRSSDGYRVSGEAWNAADLNHHMLQILNGAFSLENLADTCFLEATVSNHAGLAPLIPEGIEGVADIRLIYRLDQCLMGMCRLPTKESDGKANLHQGGIGVGIDLGTGKSLAGVHHSKVVTTHPESGDSLAGHPIPHFTEMLAIGSRVSEIVGLGYIGIDFVCDSVHGPLILEVNARPGLNIQIANQTGLRSRLT